MPYLTRKQQIEKQKQIKLISQNYPKYLHSEHWQSRRRAALKFLGEKCQKCESAENIQVHHKTYENLGCESLHDLEVLCRNCHYEHHKFDLVQL